MVAGIIISLTQVVCLLAVFFDLSGLLSRMWRHFQRVTSVESILKLLLLTKPTPSLCTTAHFFWPVS